MSNREFIIVAIRFFGFYLLVIALQSAWDLFMAFTHLQFGLAAAIEAVSPLFRFRIVKEFIQMSVPAIFGVYMIMNGTTFYQKLRTMLTNE